MKTYHIHVGYHLDDQGFPVPLAGEMQIKYSVDPWHKSPHGYVTFVHNGEDYMIPKSDIERFPARATIRKTVP
jgi:hypothetical protein